MTFRVMNVGAACRLAIVIAVGVCGAMAQEPPNPQVRVLFIGNSLTAANDLPAMIEVMAENAGLAGRVQCRAVTRPGFGLEEHWADGEALRVLRSEPWTHVVLQQGPSSLPESRVILRSFTKRFADAARERGTRVILFGVWPARDRLDFQKDVTDSYRLAAHDVGGEFVAVGDAWRRAWARDSKLPLYGPDQFHPSPLGSYVAALMFFERLTGRAGPEPDAATLRRLQVSPDAMKILRDAAAAAR